MFRPVTVGLDGSRESVAAAHWAAHEALRRNVPLRLVHVWELPTFPHAPLVGSDTLRHWSERISREGAAELQDIYPDLEIRTEQTAGLPGAVLPVVAEESELLVLGSRGLGAVAGFLVGSVSLATVAHAQRPVVLVRAGQTAEDEHQPDAAGGPSVETPYRDVVLGLGLDRPCDELIEFAFDAADRRAATLHVVHGWTLPPLYGYDPESIAPQRHSELFTEEASRLADALRPWRGKFPDVEVVEQSVIGRPAHQLVEASFSAGLVVVGRRTRRSPVGSRIGAIAHAVLHHSSAPVAVVPHD